ncbi:MAG: ATPase domain-containing protein [Candidatus Woesearchaeota archaeon]
MAKKVVNKKGNSSSMDPNRITSGIPKFDELCQGGFTRHSVNLISGGPGCGKSIFCMQFLWHGVTRMNEPGVFVSTEEEVDDLKEDALKFGWDFSQLEKEKKLVFIYFNPYDMTGLKDNLNSAIRKVNAKRVVIDSISVYGMGLENDFEVRKALYDLSLFLKETGCTSLMTSEIVEDSNGIKLSRFGVEEFLADSIVVIRFESMGGDYSRSLLIRKMRRTNNNEDIHPLEISNKGLFVHSLD